MLVTYLQDRKVNVPDLMLEPGAGMFYEPSRGSSASLVAFDVDTRKPVGFVDVRKLGHPNVKAWIRAREQGEK